MSRYGKIKESLINDQIILVISSPSNSTTVPSTLILFILSTLLYKSLTSACLVRTASAATFNESNSSGLNLVSTTLFTPFLPI